MLSSISFNKFLDMSVYNEVILTSSILRGNKAFTVDLQS
jgi:hypothetical protein